MASFDNRQYLESLEADKTTESQKEYLTFNVEEEIFGNRYSENPRNSETGSDH